MPISDAFAQIERQPNIYDVVHVKYFDEVCETRCTSLADARDTKIFLTDRWCWFCVFRSLSSWTLSLAFRTMDFTYDLILGRRYAQASLLHFRHFLF